MRKNKALWFLLTVLMALLFFDEVETGTGDTFRPPQEKVKYAAGEILVKFKGIKTLPSFAPSQEAAFIATLPTEAKVVLQQIQGRVKKAFPAIGVLHVQIPAEHSVGQAIEALYRSGAVEYAEPNYEVKVIAVPNDPKFGDQWGLSNTGQSGGTVDADIDAPEGWDVNKSSTRVIVAVIDTGVDYNHEDLSLNMWKNPGEIPGNGIDDDGNGYVDDVYGIDAYNHDTNPMDDHGHGTHCSGIIGARGHNSKGICGVGWTAKIMALKFLSSGGYGYTSDAITCMVYALAIKADYNYPRMIWSNSWGGGGYSQAFYDIVKLAQGQGVLFVAAAGNSGLDADIYPMYPAAYDLLNIISVGASERFDKYPYWSNYGSFAVDLFAPGVEIFSTLPGNNYASWSGTSMACPHVSGAAAVVWHHRYTSNWRVIKGLILNGTEDGKASPVFSKKCITEGRLNLNKSLSSAMVDDPAVFSVTPNIAEVGETITLNGVNFGTTGTLSFRGVNFGSSAIVSWTDTKIVAKVPAGLPRGFGRLLVTTTAGTSRGAAFSNVSKEAVVGKTILGHGWAASTKLGNYVWILGGATYWGQTGLVERYDLATKRSVIDTDWMLPTTVTNAGAAAIGTKIYVVGGHNWDTLEVYDTLQIFDTSTETWTYGAKVPRKILQPAVVAYGGKVYVFGGMDEYYVPLNTTYVYNPATNTWQTKAPLPTATAYAAVSLRGTTVIMVMGGFTTRYYGSEQKVVQEYNPSTNTWTTQPSMNATRGGAGGINYGSKVFCLHGSGDGTYGQADSEWFLTTWTNDIFGQQGLYTSAAGRYGDKIFSLGGFDRYLNNYSTNVWRFTSP